MGSIYKIEFPNGKHYIGLNTTTLEQRKKKHKNCAKSDDTNCILYNALRKYDMIDTFELVEIDTADTKEELCKKEIDYIQIYNSYYMNKCGYNMTLGGEGTNGYIFTEEDKKKNSEAIKKYYAETPGAIEKNREAQKEYHKKNPEARQQASEKSTKHWEKPGAREKMSEAQKKRFETPGAREKHGEARKKYYAETPGARQQTSEKSTKQWENPEAREKMSEAQKKYYAETPGAREKILDKKGHNKPFDVFLKKGGTLIKTFTYQFEAVKYLREKYNITSKLHISEVLSGQLKSSAGFLFKYKPNEEE